VQFNALTLTLQNFIAAFSGGYGRLQGSVNSLLGILVGIEVVLLGLWSALGGGENVVGVFKKILHIGAWVWIVQSYPSLCKAFVESLVHAGLLAGGGGDVSLIMDPSRLAGVPGMADESAGSRTWHRRWLLETCAVVLG